ncbi:MAG: ABC-F family ATP-binding cassette domain-containing protein [Clostridia bacterium]|nr:ABC-F family ATP-binding cassette domain-containing protein [Clostridia bacterium]
MIILALQGVQKAFGTNEVLKDVSLTLQEGERMGLVGVNGSGKSTLMKIIAGTETADGGTVTMQKGMRIGYLAQTAVLDSEQTVREVLEEVFAPVVAIEAEMRAAENGMAAAADDPELLSRLGSRYDHLTREFERGNGYGWRSTVQGVLSGLGLRGHQDMKASLLSGGERTRLCLGRMLLTEPDLLLLDEPTNHLDLASIAWLENFLAGYRGAVLVISHDRYFMDHVCGRMAELLLGTVECYDGNYTEYMRKRTAVYEARMKAWEMQQKEIAHQKAVIATYRRFNREKSIRLAESREKRLEKMELLDRPEEEGTIRFSFGCRRRTGDDVLIAEGLSKSFGERVLFSDLKLHVRAGDRIALIGDNGTGKSTLFRCLTGEMKPDRGVIRWGTGCDIGYYDQHQAGLDERKSVLDEVWDRFPRMEQYEVRGALGMFLFTGDDVFMPVSTLSGGEKGRVALTELMLKKDNILLLDEPTNHLDMDSREVLEDALKEFPGTIISISHDRYFINRFAEKIWALGSGGIAEYLGNYDDYYEKIHREQEPDGATAGMTRTAIEKERKKTREEEKRRKDHRERLKKAETDIAEAEKRLAEIEKTMSMPEVFTDPARAAELSRAYETETRRIDALYEELEALEAEDS